MPDPTVVGIDISKTHLDTYMAPAGKAARFTNDSAGFKALIAWIDQPVRSVVYEPTGPWHRAFEEALLQAGCRWREPIPCRRGVLRRRWDSGPRPTP